MDCLRDYIGIDFCDRPEPESGMYINQLPGVGLEAIDKLANSDQKTLLGVWGDVQTRGLLNFKTQLIAYFRKKYVLKQLKDQFSFGQIFDFNQVIDPDADTLRGVSIVLEPFNAENQPELSPLVSSGFTQIEFFAREAATGVRFIFANSANGGNVIDEKTIDLVQGWNTIWTEKIAPSTEFQKQITIVYDASAVKTIYTKLSGNTGVGGTGGCGCSVSIGDCCEAQVIGYVLDETTGEVTPDYTQSYGFRANAVLRCSYDGLVCANRDLFASALWYLLGEELMTERINSPRINQFTTIDLAKAKDLRKEFGERWRQELDNVIDGIELNDMGCCLECNPVVSYQYSKL